LLNPLFKIIGHLPLLFETSTKNLEEVGALERIAPIGGEFLITAIIPRKHVTQDDYEENRSHEPQHKHGNVYRYVKNG